MTLAAGATGNGPARHAGRSNIRRVEAAQGKKAAFAKPSAVTAAVAEPREPPCLPRLLA